ncbi:MAG: ABC transporter ATP-binding protein [Phycisphaerales bacterium JB040]
MITLANVSKTFQGSETPAVDGVSLTANKGETLVLLGTSGCGKTTTLKLINRLIEPSAGTVTLNDRDARDIPRTQLRRAIGYVFQDIGLFPHMSVERNITLLPRLLRWPKSKRDDRVQELLYLVGLPPDEFMSRRPEQLSGGQQQRVAIARALATDPDTLLMDEPFGALDAVTRDQLQQALLDIQRTLRKTIVFVTHDLFEALRLADRIAVMKRGRIEQLGPPRELLHQPATPFVQRLFDQARAQAALLADGGDA